MTKKKELLPGEVNRLRVHAKAYREAARIKKHSGLNNEAIKDYKKAVTRYAKLKDFLTAGEVAEEAGLFEEAIDFYGKIRGLEDRIERLREKVESAQ